MSFNIATMLRESRNAHPDKPLCHFADMSFSYAQVDEISGRVAGSLLGLGLQRGDKVAVQLPNVPQFLFIYFAIAKAGLTMVPLNPLLRAPEVAFHLSDSEAKVLVTFELFADEAMKAVADVGDVAAYVVQVPGSDARPPGSKHFDELYFSDDTGDITPTSADDTAVLLYTSGTTGRPKGAELTHFQLYMNCTIAGELFGFRDDDVGLAVLPLFHVFGLSSVLNTSVRYGGTIVLVPRFELDAVLDAMEQHQCTIFSGVPTMYFALLQADTGGHDLSAMRVGVSGGAAIPGEVIRAFEEKFPGVVILEGYGLSETASTTTFNVSDEERKVLSIGKPIWGVEVRVVGDDGKPLPPGSDHVGEIV
ncbi:MAG TPA: AMP-binding protein, partial [Mycobacteriales bacterium]|nr:AMP-binding protein [Mycobacteriales bacterium]